MVLVLFSREGITKGSSRLNIILFDIDIGYRRYVFKVDFKSV